MKQLASKVPVKTIKRTKGIREAAEPFEINEIEAFKPLNKTRQIHYPMMVKKYGLDRIDDSSLDFFRDAMSQIVR